MFGTILQRMILLELVRVFAMSLVGITGILLIAGIIAEATQHGLGPLQLLAVIPLLIPSTLPYTLPATTLFATCVVYGRLSNDNEILAIKAAGVNILRVVAPALLLGMSMTAVTLVLYFDTIPYTHHLMRTMFLADVEELLYNMLRRDGEIRHQDMQMRVKRVEGRRLLNVQCMHRDPKTKAFDVVARAREADLMVDLRQHKLLVRMKQCTITSPDGSTALVDERIWDFDLPKDFNQHRRRGADMTWREILSNRAKLQLDLASCEAEISAAVALQSLAHPPEDLKDHLFHLGNKRQQIRNEANNLSIELQMRPALSLGCLCFVLVGCPVGIWFSRSDYLSAFITCFLPIVFLYYPVMLCGINLAKGGKVVPALSIWTADTFMALVAFGLFRKLLRN